MNKPSLDIKGSIIFEVDQVLAEDAGFIDLSLGTHLAMISNKNDSITLTVCGRTFTGMIVKNNISHYPSSLSLEVEFRIVKKIHLPPHKDDISNCIHGNKRGNCFDCEK